MNKYSEIIFINRNFKTMLLLIAYGVFVSLNICGSAENKTLANDAFLLGGSSYTALSLVKVAFPTITESQAEDLFEEELITIKLWTQRKNSALVMRAFATKDNDPINIEMVLIENKEKKGPKILAIGKEIFSGTVRGCMFCGDMISFDFANYKIKENEAAFGLRYHTSYSSTGYSSSGTELYLFRVNEDKIEKILQMDVGSWHVDKANAENVSNGEEIETNTVVVMDKKKTNDFYDLVLKTKKKTTSFAEEKEQDARQDGEVKIEKTQDRYQWSGSRYEKRQ